MKVFIVSDLEGVSGVTKPGQTVGGSAMYEESRRLYTEEINAAVRGAEGGGGDRDRRHGLPRRRRGVDFNSLIPELLDEACDFVVQDAWTEYTAFLESGVDAALFVGMHAMAGTRHGVMNHTVSGQVWQNLWFNGVLVGETGINAALCGAWGCPVLMVTGDEAACDEARDLLGPSLDDGRRQAGDRRAVGAQHRPAARSGADRGGRTHGARRPHAPSSRTCPASPCEIQVEYKNTRAPDALRHRQGVERVSDRMIVSRADNWWDAWRQFFF